MSKGRGPRAGRPPKPPHLRIIEGNPGKRAIVEGPKAPPSRPRCPSWLPPEAKAEWRRVTDILDRLGVLTSVDRSTLAAYCSQVAILRDATEALGRTGLLVKGRREGEAVKNPLLQVQRDAARLVATYSAMFGLSPADRVRLAGGATAPAGDDLERLLADR